MEKLNNIRDQQISNLTLEAEHARQIRNESLSISDTLDGRISVNRKMIYNKAHYNPNLSWDISELNHEIHANALDIAELVRQCKQGKISTHHLPTD